MSLTKDQVLARITDLEQECDRAQMQGLALMMVRVARSVKPTREGHIDVLGCTGQVVGSDAGSWLVSVLVDQLQVALRNARVLAQAA